MSPKYELVVVLQPSLDEAALQAELEKIVAIISKHQGVVTTKESWGKKLLSYPIKKQTYGIYVLLEFTGDDTVVSDLNRQLGITDSVLRHLVVLKDKHSTTSVIRFEEEVEDTGRRYPSARFRPSAGDDDDDSDEVGADI